MPAIHTVPTVACKSAVKTPRVVDLPAPLIPRRPNLSDFSQAKSIPIWDDDDKMNL